MTSASLPILRSACNRKVGGGSSLSDWSERSDGRDFLADAVVKGLDWLIGTGSADTL